MYKVPVTVLLVVINVIYTSLGALKRIKCDDNALNKPCPQKRKIDIDCSTDNSSLPAQKKMIN